MATVTDLIPHRAPWLLIDRIVEVGAGRLRAEKRLSAGDPLLADGLAELLLVEALAQAAACLHGHARGGRAVRGLLVAASGFEFQERAQAGDTVELDVRQIAALGALVRCQGEARLAGGGRLLARGQMTFALEAE